MSNRAVSEVGPGDPSQGKQALLDDIASMEKTLSESRTLLSQARATLGRGEGHLERMSAAIALLRIAVSTDSLLQDAAGMADISEARAARAELARGTQEAITAMNMASRYLTAREKFFTSRRMWLQQQEHRSGNQAI